MSTVLRKGSTGEAVRNLEKLLITRGYTVSADADFNEDTERAVMDFQKANGLVVDGVAGPKTIDTLISGTRNQKSLTQQDIVQAATLLGVSVASIHAVNEVESSGKGFFEDGRAVILYERHIMYRRMKAAGLDADGAMATYPNLVNTKPGGYRGGWPEYTRLKSAQSINSDIALESCSWGLFQIMGYHWDPLGYASINDFVQQMQAGEGNQLTAFVKFIQADPNLLKALKAKKWVDFARIYNGPAYKDNLYDAKLARAYDRYAATDSEAT